MTEIYIRLIEKVGGIEIARGIVGGAPKWATYYTLSALAYHMSKEQVFSSDVKINDISTAIAQYDQTSVCHHEK